MRFFSLFCSLFNSTVFTLFTVFVWGMVIVYCICDSFQSTDSYVCFSWICCFFLCRTELSSSNWNLIKAENVLRLQQTEKKKSSIWLNIQWKHSNGKVMCAFNCTLNNNLIHNHKSHSALGGWELGSGKQHKVRYVLDVEKQDLKIIK